MTGTWLFGTELWFMVSPLRYLAYVSWKHFKLRAKQDYARAEEGCPSSVSQIICCSEEKVETWEPCKVGYCCSVISLCSFTLLCIILGALFHHWLWDCRNEVIWKICCSKPNTCSEYFSSSAVEVCNTVPLTLITSAWRSSLKPGLHLMSSLKRARVLCGAAGVRSSGVTQQGQTVSAHY